jgi:NADP-dependent alcohol dehydrogenase
MEQYMTYPTAATLQDRISEGILSTLIEISDTVIAHPEQYDVAANFMWCCNMALNGIIQKGVPTDWSIHAIGHEITAAYGIDHARTLAIVLPSLYRHKLDKKEAKLAQYGRRVLGLTGDDRTVSMAAIDRTEEFFRGLGIGTTLSDYQIERPESFPAQCVAAMEAQRTIILGEHKDIRSNDVKLILKAAI